MELHDSHPRPVPPRGSSPIVDLTAYIERLSALIKSPEDTDTHAELQNALEELKIAEETLIEQNHALADALERAQADRQRYVELFELAPDGYCVTDEHGVIQEANRSLCDLLQADPAGILGKPLPVFVAPEHRAELRAFVARVAQQTPQPNAYPVIWQTEFRINTTKPVDVSARCSASRKRDNPSAEIRWVLHDISRRKELEDAAKQLNVKLEQAVRAKTSELVDKVQELEQFHDVAVGRELRLMELEKKIDRLEKATKDDPLTG